MSEVRPAIRSLPALAARAQLGDRNALEELLRQLQPALSDHIRGLVRDDDLAADVLQEALIIVCRRLGTVRETEWIRAWAYRVATREAFRAVRHARRDRGEPLESMPDTPHSTDDDFGIEAAMGVFGMLSYMVVTRRREIGVRIALGAGQSSVVQMVVASGLAHALIGSALGLVAALVGTRALTTVLYDVSAGDPATLAFATLALLGWRPHPEAAAGVPWPASRVTCSPAR